MRLTQNGLLAARYAKALAVGHQSKEAAIAYASAQAWPESAHVSSMIRMATVVAGDVADHAGLINDAGISLVEAARPLTILGRLAGVRRTPFDVPTTNTLGGARGLWTGAGDALPVARFSYDAQIKLRRRKFGSIVILTDELLQSAAINGDLAIQRELVASLVETEDQSFIAPLQAGTTDVQPASITYNQPSFVASGSTAATISSDLKLLVGSLVSGGSNLSAAHWVMDHISATHMAGLADSFPGITARGGTLMGLPVITSSSLVRTGSPSTGYICLVDGDGVLLADDNQAAIMVSKNAAVEMDGAPSASSTTPTAASLVSLLQTNSSGVRIVRWMNWQARRSVVSAVLSGVTY